MDAELNGGKMELLWSKSYNGSKIEYIDQQTYCYVNGKNVVFSDGKKPFVFPGKGISAFAVHKWNKYIAIGSRGLDPSIEIYSFPSFETYTTIASCAKLEYCMLAFSSSDYLVSLSGIPDFQLCIWNYIDGIQLCSSTMLDEIPFSLSFNPGNWQELALTYTDSIYYSQIAKCDTYMELNHKIFSCPATEESKLTKSAKPPISSVYENLDLTQAAKAGQIGERAKALENLLEKKKCVIPVSHCWLPSGDLYIGCEQGYIFKMDADSKSELVLVYPTDSGKEKPENDVQVEQMNSIDFMTAHSIGLLALSKNGLIYQFDISVKKTKLICEYNTNLPISTMTLTLDDELMLIGSSEGIIQLHKADKLNEIKVLFNESSSPFVDVKCVYPGTHTAATIQQDGLVQLWDIGTGKKCSSMSLRKRLCSLDCSPVSTVLAVGCVTGHVFIIDVINLKNPRLIYCTQLCNAAIIHTQFDSNGEYLFTGSESNHMFIQDGSEATKFEIYGYINFKGPIVKFTIDSSKDVVVYVIVSQTLTEKEVESDKLYIFQLYKDFKNTYKEKYLTPECDFDHSKIQMKDYTLLSETQGLTVCNGETYVHSQKSNKLIQLPLNAGSSMLQDFAEVMFVDVSYDCHQLPGIDLQFSDDKRWLISCGKDGTLQLCATNNMNKSVVSFSSHDFYQSCAKSLCLSADCTHVLLTSQDGTVSCYEITYTSDDAIKDIYETKYWLLQKNDQMKNAQFLKTEAIEKMPTVENPFEGELKTEEVENEVSPTEEKSGHSSELLSPILKGSWIEIKKAKLLHEKNKEFAGTKKHIKDSIKQMRRTVKEMLITNENLPEMQQLERYEFDLDVEEQARQQQEAKEAVTKVYEKIEQKNLGKLYVQDIIKRQCYDDMKVKGRSLQGFLAPLRVTNFPLLERSQTMLNNLEVFKNQRTIEKEVAAINEEIMDSFAQPTVSPTEVEVEESGKESKQEEEAPVVVQDMPATEGSLGTFYGGNSEYLYNQFHLRSRYQKVAQIYLLQDILYQIKETFNKEFDELYQKKEMEISRIKEKNKRIAQIIDDLTSDEEMFHPEMNFQEKPELLLVVQDSEVKIEKYMTAEERKAALEKEMAEIERRKKDNADNMRDRGLMQMMNGVLQIKKEDELKKDIPMPHVNEKEEERTEEEVKLMKEYERKVQELNEEREKYRKTLESEMKKIQSSIVESMTAFDEQLDKLFEKQIHVIKAMHQEKLKINRLKLNLTVQNVLDCQERELILRKEKEIEEQRELFNVLVKIETMIYDYRTNYDNLVTEDKTIDKNFKNEFPGISHNMVDQLHKLFKKRPKTFSLKVSSASVNSPERDSNANPQQESGSSSRPKSATQALIESTLKEMDKLTNSPDGVDSKVWAKFCQIRRNKVYKEQQVRNSALTLAEMNAFHQEKIETQERLRNKIDAIEHEIKSLKKTRQKFDINLEIQLLLKQGQVELETGMFTYNFNDSVLIHRSIIEELNSKIKELAEQKISSMEESKDFKKGIFQQEWEHRKMMMQMEDLRLKMNDIKFFKVTREVQKYLENADYDAQKTAETEKLEKSLTGIQEVHKGKLKKIAEDITHLRMKVFRKEKENESLSKQIETLNVEVNERQHIVDVSSEKRDYLDDEKKYHCIRQRKRMVELAKSQAAERAVLRKEVERLRMKTFPAFL